MEKIVPSKAQTLNPKQIVENIVPSLSTPKGSFWIMKPEEGCPTGQVYKNLGLSPGQVKKPEAPNPKPCLLGAFEFSGSLIIFAHTFYLPGLHESSLTN